MNIAISPLTSDNNRFIAITVGCLCATGAEVYEFYPILKSPLRFLKTDVVILNWFESLGKKPLARTFKFLAKVLIIELLKLFRKKVVYVFHNRMSHEESGKALSRFFMRYLCGRADRLLILSRDSRAVLGEYLSPRAVEKKVRYIPHPNYIGAYPEPQSPPAHTAGSRPLALLFVGAIRPYKNVELILTAARKFQGRPVRFIIAGRPRTPEYGEELRAIAGSLANVSLQLEFIGDDRLIGLVRSSDALMLPYDQKSSLNSGAVLLAFSNRKTVVCPRIATLNDFPPELCYGYSYEKPEQHEAAFCSQIERIIGDYEKDPGILDRKADELYRIVERFNSREAITDCYRAFLAELD